MLDFPITELLDDQGCLGWLERYLHPNGWVCPHCESPDRRFFRKQAFPAYRCRACDGYYTLLTTTVFEGTRQTPATVVLILRGVAKGETTARLSRELGLDRKRLGEIRQHLQQNLYETLPTEQMEGTEFEADELYQNAGEKKSAPSRPRRPTATAGEQATGTRYIR